MMSLFYMGSLFLIGLFLGFTSNKNIEKNKEFTTQNKWIKSLDSISLDRIKEELKTSGYAEYIEYGQGNYGRMVCIEKLAELKSKQGRDCRYF